VALARGLRAVRDPGVVSGTRTDRAAAGGGASGWAIGCECGYVARGADEAALVADARRHARDEHGLELSAEQILRSARPPGDAGGGREQG
jgi:predicted small metal-binding protein